jgi:dynein heavy chain
LPLNCYHLQEREASLKSKCAAVQKDGEKIHAMIKENLDYFEATEDSENWRHYTEYLDDLVVDGFFECVACSLRYLMENMDKARSTEEAAPLMEAKFELQVRCKV